MPPLTQDRFIDLIEIAENLLDKLELAREINSQIGDAIYLLETNQKAEYIMNKLNGAKEVANEMLFPDRYVIGIVEKERAYFNQSRVKRNTTMRRVNRISYNKRKRGAVDQVETQEQEQKAIEKFDRTMEQLIDWLG